MKSTFTFAGIELKHNEFQVERCKHIIEVHHIVLGIGRHISRLRPNQALMIL